MEVKQAFNKSEVIAGMMIIFRFEVKTQKALKDASEKPNENWQIPLHTSIKNDRR